MQTAASQEKKGENHDLGVRKVGRLTPPPPPLDLEVANSMSIDQSH